MEGRPGPAAAISAAAAATGGGAAHGSQVPGAHLGGTAEAGGCSVPVHVLSVARLTQVQIKYTWRKIVSLHEGEWRRANGEWLHRCSFTTGNGLSQASACVNTSYS